MTKRLLEIGLLNDVMCAAAAEVFSTMLGVEVEVAEPATGAAVESEDQSVVSLLGLTGDWTGSAGLFCQADCARWMASQMLFSEYPQVNDEVRDAVGEITNMIVGNFKNNIAASTGPLGMSTPTVICGTDMKASIGGAHEWVVFPFKCQDHFFRMMVQLHPAKQAMNSRMQEAMHPALVS